MGVGCHLSEDDCGGINRLREASHPWRLSSGAQMVRGQPVPAAKPVLATKTAATQVHICGGQHLQCQHSEGKAGRSSSRPL